MEIVTVEELEAGDKIMITGMADNEYYLVTVERVTDDGLIIPVELGGLDYTPEYPESIIRLPNTELTFKDLTL